MLRSNAWLLSCCTLLVFCQEAHGQLFPTDRYSGRPYMLRTYDDYRGYPYLVDDWRPADLTDNKGTVWLQVPVKLDIYNNNLIYLAGGKEYEFVSEIVEFRVFGAADDSGNQVFRKGFAINDKVMPDTWVQVMDTGRVLALRHTYKVIEETTEYNLPGKIKTFAQRQAWYFSANGTWREGKPGAKLLEELSAERWSSLQEWMRLQGLNPKKEADFLLALRHLNSLP